MEKYSKKICFEKFEMYRELARISFKNQFSSRLPNLGVYTRTMHTRFELYISIQVINFMVNFVLQERWELAVEMMAFCVFLED